MSGKYTDELIERARAVFAKHGSFDPTDFWLRAMADAILEASKASPSPPKLRVIRGGER